VCLFLNPLDCLRVRWQSSVGDLHRANTINSFARQIVQREGFWMGLWKPSLVCNVVGVGVCNSLRFAWYGSDHAVH
jgi:hypothetical protein